MLLASASARLGGVKKKTRYPPPPPLVWNIVSSSAKMTAKHRRGKGNHKHGEDNFFKNDASETEVRNGSSNYAPHLVVLLAAVVLLGGATGAWFCLQQQQSLAQLTDSLTGMQVKMVKLQSSHEEVRQSSSKVRDLNFKFLKDHRFTSDARRDVWLV